MASIHYSTPYKILRLLILFLFLFSMYPWVTWRLDQRVVWGFALIFISLIYSIQKDIFETKVNYPFASVAIFAMIMWMQRQTVMAAVFGIGLWWCIHIFLQIKSVYKEDIIHFMTKWFGIILGISLFIFILSKLGMPFPHKAIIFNNSSSYDIFNNYYFYVQLSDTDYFRFSGIFLEPGHMTMGLAPLIFLNKFNIKDKYVAILLAAQVFSFSLAGYIILIFGFIWQIIISSQKKQNFKLSILLALAFLSFTYFVTQYFSSDVFSSLIVDRLKFEDGQLVGNDRMNEYFASVFASYIQSKEFIIGMGAFDAEEFFVGHGNSGWQVYAYIYGLIGLLAAIISYISPCVVKKINSNTIGFCLLLILLLMGNGYPTWWCMLIHLTIGAYTLKWDKD